MQANILPLVTEEEFAELEAMQSDAKTVGFTLGLWQLFMMLALGKAINSMWVLINSSQFFVFIS